MPELPEVETIVRGLAKVIVGQKIISLKTTALKGDKIIIEDIKTSSNLPSIVGGVKKKFISAVIGSTIKGINRRGKSIIIELSGGHSLIVHLKMTGQLIYTDSSDKVIKHTHLIFNLSDGKELRYVDVRRFGYIKIFPSENIFLEHPLDTLGHEPIEIKIGELRELLSNHKIRMKSFLLNQSFMSGIGNIYADEILHRSHMHPLKISSNLSGKETAKLHKMIKEVLREAIEHRGSTIRDYVTSTGEAGDFQKMHRVYNKEGKPCRCCQGKIIKIRAGGRSTFFCPACQPIDDK
ncbi:MAG: bifunctional DNA-formamidopyrimidine glycosylase/DNA-(apurinic or apyrimidinic site) lyase [Nitrospinota bacterium]|nr:bifunctional DNA-formamidopyrimidine glycosylase/DNA-(apurinic or apyrimidinic site) lyase [Nitrospinota bacterium]